jgi:hypothetical protein
MAKIKKHKKHKKGKYKGMGKHNYMKWVRSHKKV